MYFLKRRLGGSAVKFNYIIHDSGDSVAFYDSDYGIMIVDRMNLSSMTHYTGIVNIENDIILGSKVMYGPSKQTVCQYIYFDGVTRYVLGNGDVVSRPEITPTNESFLPLGTVFTLFGVHYKIIGYKGNSRYACVNNMSGYESVEKNYSEICVDETTDIMFCMHCRRLRTGPCECTDYHVCSCGTHTSNTYTCDLCLLRNKISKALEKPCSVCGNMTTRELCGDVYMCDACLNARDYRKCVICGRPSVDFKYILDDRKFIGKDCESKYSLHFCKRCNSHFHKYCECNIPKKSYDYKPPMYSFLKLPSDTTNLYVGVEIEIDGRKGSQSALCNAILDDYYNIFYFKHDGSLTDNGIEMPSHPMTPEFFRALDWSKIFDIIKSADFDDNSRTGLHFHLSRKHFTQTEIAKLVFLVDYYYDNVILDVSRRDYDDMKRWALRAYGRTYSDHSRYLKYVDERGGEHHSAVNITNQHTVELRFFKGTYDYKEFLKSFEFVMLLVDIVKTKSWDEIKTYFPKDDTTDNSSTTGCVISWA